jgi:hypothetical protein
VHAGPIRVCEVFLGENSVKYPVEKVARLRKALGNFLSSCERAIKVNGNLIKEDQKVKKKKKKKKLLILLGISKKFRNGFLRY